MIVHLMAATNRCLVHGDGQAWPQLWLHRWGRQFYAYLVLIIHEIYILELILNKIKKMKSNKIYLWLPFFAWKVADGLRTLTYYLWKKNCPTLQTAYVTSKRIELDGPSWSGLVKFWIFYKTWPTGAFLLYLFRSYMHKKTNVVCRVGQFFFER